MNLGVDFGCLLDELWLDFGTVSTAKMASKSDLSWLSWPSYLILPCLTKPNIGSQESRSGLGGFGAKATHKGISPQTPPKTDLRRQRPPAAAPVARALYIV